MYMRMYMRDMSKRYSMAEARKNLPSILDDAEAGSVVEITRRGKAVAVVIGQSEIDRLRGSSENFLEELIAFRAERGLDKDGLDRKFFRSLRSKDTGRKVKL